jgi:hypothetical protein
MDAHAGEQFVGLVQEASKRLEGELTRPRGDQLQRQGDAVEVMDQGGQALEMFGGIHPRGTRRPRAVFEELNTVLFPQSPQLKELLTVELKRLSRRHDEQCFLGEVQPLPDDLRCGGLHRFEVVQHEQRATSSRERLADEDRWFPMGNGARQGESEGLCDHILQICRAA